MRLLTLRINDHQKSENKKSSPITKKSIKMSRIKGKLLRTLTKIIFFDIFHHRSSVFFSHTLQSGNDHITESGELLRGFNIHGDTIIMTMPFRSALVDAEPGHGFDVTAISNPPFLNWTFETVMGVPPNGKF